MISPPRPQRLTEFAERGHRAQRTLRDVWVGSHQSSMTFLMITHLAGFLITKATRQDVAPAPRHCAVWALPSISHNVNNRLMADA